MLAKRFEKPKKAGESKSSLVNLIKSGNDDDRASKGKSNFIKYGARTKAKSPTQNINKKKKEKTLSIKFLASSSFSSNFSIRNGMRTEMETIEATVTNKISGILKAE